MAGQRAETDEEEAMLPLILAGIGGALLLRNNPKRRRKARRRNPLLNENSLGKPIASTPEALERFWKWFGDSKVVDDKGRPLVVYHGTKREFDAFDGRKAGKSDPGLVGKAFYFTPSERQARDIAESGLYGEGESPTVLAVYVAASKPAAFVNGDLADGTSLLDLHPDGLTKKSAAAARKRFTSSGSDGVVFYDRSPSGQSSISQVAVYSPSQIKSATGNRGTFDPTDPVITNPLGRLKRAAKLPRRLGKALRRGARVEREHTGDAKTARVIASHHLAEDPRYYEKLATIEKHNPPTAPVMSYAQAHAWEPQAVERKVSVVARSPRGFMRAYQRAGSWSKLDPWWQRRRNNFVARHLAQAGINGERLWEQVRGKWRPTRRGLALLMWAAMPPGRPAGARP